MFNKVQSVDSFLIIKKISIFCIRIRRILIFCSHHWIQIDSWKSWPWNTFTLQFARSFINSHFLPLIFDTQFDNATNGSSNLLGTYLSFCENIVHWLDVSKCSEILLKWPGNRVIFIDVMTGKSIKTVENFVTSLLKQNLTFEQQSMTLKWPLSILILIRWPITSIWSPPHAAWRISTTLKTSIFEVIFQFTDLIATSFYATSNISIEWRAWKFSWTVLFIHKPIM